MMTHELLSNLAHAIAELDMDKALKLTKEMLAEDVSAVDITKEGIMLGMRAVGEKFENRECFLSDLMFVAKISDECIKLLKPQMEKEVKNIPSVGKAVVGTVQGDLHTIGKKIFISLMTASGFEVYDLGVDVPAETFVEKVKEVCADILGASALLSTTTPHFKEIHEVLKKAELRDKVHFMIGGPPLVTAEEVGADYYTNDAFAGVREALEHMRKKNST